MNKTLLPIAALFLLVACGQEEPAATTQDDAAPIEEQLTGEPVVEAAEEAADTIEETLEVVEESAAEPEDTGETEIILAQANVPATTVSFNFVEGTHYRRLMPTQPTIGGADKIEVAEFFWYGCAHCYTFEPTINGWDARKPANVRFVRIPAMWNDVVKLHAQLYYTEEVLVRNGAIQNPEAFRSAVFEEYHRRGNRLVTIDSIKRLFTQRGVDGDEFDRTWGSFEVAQKLRVAADLARRYNIASVPTIVVNGKYVTGAAEAGSNETIVEVIDELIVRESAR